ncbi:unnamed protein product [Arctia plantaginis]|uniref:Integrase catalytic domain-containing protein n=1 Tax=Arctia plantaginis TaxID=874455 RepID=A0A8S1A689_ARCPL|nr:unnamed protein product [Arctia plantaginis]
MDRLQFEFTVIASNDAQSNVLTITLISTEEGKCYVLPEELKPVSHHIYIVKMNTFTKVKNSIKKSMDKIGLMSQLGPATKPFEIMSMDTIGGFGGSRSTNKYLHLLVDHYTRYAFIATSKTQNASDLINLTKKVLETDEIELS